MWTKYLQRRSQRRQRRKNSRSTQRTQLRVESLERRELFAVGASGLAPMVNPGVGYDGVVQVNTPNGFCSGTLLSTGRHILTAAHCVDFDVDGDGDGQNDGGNGVIDAGNYSVTFDLNGRTETIRGMTASDVFVPNGWTGSFRNDDIAIIELTELAPVDAERYEIYSGQSEVGKVITFVGYGNSGRGAAAGTQPAGHVVDRTKRLGRNRIDSSRSEFLVIDLDNPAGSGDVWREAVTAPGDSGGPAFWGTTIVGVASGSNLQSRFNATTGLPSYGWTGNAYGAWSDFTRVSDYADWIEGVIDNPYDLTIDLATQPVGNDGDADGVRFSFNSSTWNMEIHVNGELYFNDHWSRIRSVHVEGTSDAEHFQISSLNLLDDISVDGNFGRDTLAGFGSGLVNQWTIDGADRGSLTNGLQDVEFRSIEVLYGGDRNDTFKFVGNGARISTAIYGGAGRDKLDYSRFGQGVNVDLEERRSTAVGGGAKYRVVGFEDVHGSRFDDRIVGNQVRNRIWGDDGDDQIWGGAAGDYLYGGDGDDKLYGQDGVDYLFGQDDDDFLDGGDDGDKDYLYGGAGSDLFDDNRKYVGTYVSYWGYQDVIRDWDTEDRVYKPKVYAPYYTYYSF